MAVYELNDGQLLRVARSIDGKLEQKYFSLIGLNKTNQREVRRQAKALDEKWADKQGDAKNKRVREASTSNRHSTGVRGINMVFRPSPAFRVQIQSDGRSYVREFSVRRLTAEGAWTEACRFLSGVRGYKSVPRGWKQRMPKVPKKAPQGKGAQSKGAQSKGAQSKGAQSKSAQSKNAQRKAPEKKSPSKASAAAKAPKKKARTSAKKR